MRIEPITDLPAQIDILRADALEEGFDNVEVLVRQWREQAVQFTRPGEMLVAAIVESELAGVGGISQDFVDADWLRMRRFYVRPKFRRHGVGKAMARYLLERAIGLDRPIVLYTDTSRGAEFWQAMGFVPVKREKTTHILPRL